MHTVLAVLEDCAVKEELNYFVHDPHFLMF